MNLWTDILRKLAIPLLVTLFIALGFEYTTYRAIDPGVFGIHPRDFSTWSGIFTVPLVHGSVSHLMNNLVAFLLLSSMLYIIYSSIANRVLGAMWLLTGCFMFLFARDQFYHIGASGVVYAFIFYLIAAGFMNRSKTPVVIALIVSFYYGGAIWGLFPLDSQVSWDGHISGAVAGIVTAVFTRKRIAKLFPKERRPEWFDDEDSENDNADAYQQFDGRRKN